MLDCPCSVGQPRFLVVPTDFISSVGRQSIPVYYHLPVPRGISTRRRSIVQVRQHPAVVIRGPVEPQLHWGPRSRPNISSAGASSGCLTADLYAIRMKGKWVSQSFWCFEVTIASCCAKVRWNLSTSLATLRMKGVVRVFSNP
ncbi:hypothetical protein DPEC_G00379320 [Dallia pectoralis]|nr:hypothetical protein DPEC_G00379320 [Dallia pectoralis]